MFPKISVLLLLLLLISCTSLAHAFVTRHHHNVNNNPTASSTTCLGMGKSINKQAELRKKLELAKKKKEQPTTQKDETATTKSQNLSAEEMKEQNDRKRFEELLQQSKASAVWNDYASADDYKNYEQIEEDIEAQRKGVERLFEGDPAPEECFEGLVIPQTELVLGKAGKERLVPWLGKAAANHNDYILIVCDPRPDSPDLQSTAQTLWSALPADLRQRLVIINADSPAQNRKWLKKNDWSTAGPTVYSDAQREWMTAYTALGDKRWSMTLFVLASGRVQKLVRDLDVYTASKVVPKAVAAFQEAKL